MYISFLHFCCSIIAIWDANFSLNNCLEATVSQALSGAAKTYLHINSVHLLLKSVLTGVFLKYYNMFI